MAPAIYVPPAGFRTRLDDFRDCVNKKYDLNLKDYHELHEFSVTRLNDFWLSVWKFTGIQASIEPTRALKSDNPAIYPPPEFFPNARLNFAENLLRGRDDAPAVIEMDETNINSPTRYTWRDLKDLTARYASVLKRLLR